MKDIRRGIYIIPTLFTCGNMTFGFLAMLSSMNGFFTRAAWFLICAIACDMLDGRIARMTKTSSEFGVQMDSLSDLISFGLAPATIMYNLVLNTMGTTGIAVAVVFVLSSALRLAKFNVLSQDGVAHKTFAGLPTPASAGVIISFVLSYSLLNPTDALTVKTIPILMNSMPIFFKAMPVVMLCLSFLMVSNIPYWSFKTLNFSKARSFRLVVSVIVMIVLAIAYPQNILFIVFLGYALSGILSYILRFFLRKRHPVDAKDKNNEN